jgi:hypothetical protein
MRLKPNCFKKNFWPNLRDIFTFLTNYSGNFVSIFWQFYYLAVSFKLLKL